ncbi:hypothetical protein TKK_0011567 [Trichogramma kaykai]
MENSSQISAEMEKSSQTPADDATIPRHEETLTELLEDMETDLEHTRPDRPARLSMLEKAWHELSRLASDPNYTPPFDTTEALKLENAMVWEGLTPEVEPNDMASGTNFNEVVGMYERWSKLRIEEQRRGGNTETNYEAQERELVEAFTRATAVKSSADEVFTAPPSEASRTICCQPSSRETCATTTERHQDCQATTPDADGNGIASSREPHRDNMAEGSQVAGSVTESSESAITIESDRTSEKTDNGPNNVPVSAVPTSTDTEDEPTKTGARPKVFSAVPTTSAKVPLVQSRTLQPHNTANDPHWSPIDAMDLGAEMDWTEEIPAEETLAISTCQSVETEAQAIAESMSRPRGYNPRRQLQASDYVSASVPSLSSSPEHFGPKQLVSAKGA